ncbi:MAG TPA: lactate racemase domain-containing protein, partial [Acidimicrobiales bacterium]|nr:lactate racemase domain-containing protein [Acidimicrobiales bacterium]
MRLPAIVRVRQHLDRPRIDDVPAAVRATLAHLELERRIKPGHTVALTAGSRGIANIPAILRAVADNLKSLGARPFLVPTMGSHGGGVAEGQRQIIESYGITEQAVGVPIKASMDTIQVGTTSEGYPVFLDKHASQADHVGVVARIKPHTAFHGPIESGLLKMMLIGLGKHTGALAYHRILLEQPYDAVVRSVAKTMLEKAPIAFGLGVVENAYDETALVEAVHPERFVQREEALLVKARDWLPRLPVLNADLLVIDEIGKDVSGSGMDTNVVGRKRAFRGQPAPPGMPVIRLIFVRGLTEHTHGNASGIGLADFTTTRLVREMNYSATVINCLTAGYPEGAFTPVHFDTDREVIEAALKIIGTREPHEGRVLRIRDTLHLDELEVSEAVLADPNLRTRLEVLGPGKPWTFDASG